MTTQTLQARLADITGVPRSDNLEVGTLSRPDIPELALLHMAAYGSSPTAEMLMETVEHMAMYFDGAFGQPLDDSFVGAWTQDGTMVGAVMCVIDSPWDDAPDGPFIVDLVVAPEYRRQGIATMLVGEIARRACTWGRGDLSLRINRHHSGAAELYDVLGFSQVD